jgi:phosphatidylserine decarboxylase
MKLAQGTFSWLRIPIILTIVFFITIFFSSYNIQSIFLLMFVICILIIGFLIMFFRDPDRKIGSGIVAVADGKIQKINKIDDKYIGKCFQICTFMNIYNVHVNRMPCNGIIESIKHIPGGLLPAFTKESDRNEQVEIIIKTDFGKIKIIQIAGTIAKRIVPYIKSGQKLKKGDRIGIIRLGSRVDIYLAEKNIKKIFVKKNDRVIAGVDCIAEVND